MPSASRVWARLFKRASRHIRPSVWFLFICVSHPGLSTTRVVLGRGWLDRTIRSAREAKRGNITCGRAPNGRGSRRAPHNQRGQRRPKGTQIATGMGGRAAVPLSCLGGATYLPPSLNRYCFLPLSLEWQLGGATRSFFQEI